MPSSFFSKFPKIKLNASEIVNHPIMIDYPNLFRHVDVLDRALEGFNNYEYYQIPNGARPDQVSHYIYETPDYYWTFFVLNDRLKNGFDQWPLSDQALSNFISAKYNDYGVVSIFPEVLIPGVNDEMVQAWHIDLIQGSLNVDLMEDLDYPIIVSNFMAGLDLTYPRLRLRRIFAGFNQLSTGQNDPTFNRGRAQIEGWDPIRFQLWLKNVTDSLFFADGDNIESDNMIRLEFVDDNPSHDPIIDNEDQNWLDGLQDLYRTFLGDDSFILDPDNIVFRVSSFYEDGMLAPHHFVSDATQEDVPFADISNIYNNLLCATPIPFYEWEREGNDEKRYIKVIKPEFIRAFVNRYQDLISKTK